MAEETVSQPVYNTPEYNYTPAGTVASNVDMAALVEAAVAKRLAEIETARAEAAKPRVVTPEEAARSALDNRGYGLGVDERLAELYAHLDTVAKKVGV